MVWSGEPGERVQPYNLRTGKSYRGGNATWLASVEHTKQDRVFYDLGRDLIVMPHREQFTSAAAYYESALHELGHWTGHPGRMSRESLVEGVQQGPKSLEYSREELRPRSVR